jgi:hypothetical protein
MPESRRHFLARSLPVAVGLIGQAGLMSSTSCPRGLNTFTDALTSVLNPPLHSLQAAASDNPLAARVVAEARRTLATMRQTHYQHHAHIDPGAGIYDCDCSEFVGYILEQVASANYRLIPKEPNHPRPRAFKYCDYFRSLPENANGWHPIHKIASIRPGDIIAWRAPDIVKDEDTGHVMIVAAPAQPRGPGLFTVRVYDSSVLPHVDDTRGSNKSSYRSGVGEGGIVFRVDSSGRPIAFQFRPPDRFHSNLIGIARIQLLS